VKNTQLFQNLPFLKVIAGIENFDAGNIREVAAAANGIAAAIDVSVDEASVRWIKAHTDLQVFVSSLDPKALAESIEWGTDWVELGNFQPIYDRGAVINPDMVLTWTRELVSLVKDSARICVTLPGILDLKAQIQLAQELELLGVDLLQIENITGDINHVAPIQAAVNIPVMLSGKLHLNNLAEAVETGAEGFGVGAAIRKADDMSAYVSALQNQLQAVRV
jgi:hypothetical protein